MWKEDSIRKLVESMDHMDLIVFEAKVGRISIAHRYQYLDQVLMKFLLDEELITDYSKIKYMPMLVCRDYRKGLFTMLISLHAGFRNNLNNACLC